MVKTKHRVTGIVLAVLLVLSTLLVGTASVAAVDNDDRSSGFVSNTAVSGMPSTLYFKPNSNWIVENARFAAYFYVDNDHNDWAEFTPVAGESQLYKCTVPTTGNWVGIVFCRYDPKTQGTGWSRPPLWNQSKDVLIDGSDNNLVTLLSDENGWDNVSGVWSKYSGSDDTEPVTDKPTDPVTDKPTDPVTDKPTDPVTNPSNTLVVNGKEYSLGSVLTYTTTIQEAKKLSAIAAHVSISGKTDALELLSKSSDNCTDLSGGSVVVNFAPNDNSKSVYISALDAENGYSVTNPVTLITLSYKVIGVGGSVNIQTYIDELYDMNKGEVTTAKAVTTLNSKDGPTDAPTDPPTSKPTDDKSGVTINGKTFKKDDVIEFTATLSSSDLLYGIAGNVKFDSNYVKLSDDQFSEAEMLPVLVSNGNYQLDLKSVANTVSFNAMSDPDAGYNFKSADTVLIKIKFVVTASTGTTSITSNVTEAYSMTLDSDGVPKPVTVTPANEVELYEQSDPVNGVIVNGKSFKKGDTIEFTVKTQFADIIDSAQGILDYDPNYLTLVKKPDSEVFPKLYDATSFTANYDAQSSTSGFKRCNYSMVGGNADFRSAPDVFSKFTFTVTAESGSTTITHSFGDIVNKSLQNVSPTSKSETVALATSQPSGVIVNGKSFKKGDTIVFTVYTQFDDIIDSAQGILDYDPNYLTLVKKPDSEVFPKLYDATSFTANYNAQSSTSGFKRCNYSMVGGNADFTATSSVFSKFTFTVTAESGSTTITHSFGDIVNKSLQKVSPKSKSETVTLAAAPTDGVYVNGTKFHQGDVIEYIGYLKTSDMVGGVNFKTLYDTAYLKFSSEQLDSEQMYPNMSSGYINNDFTNPGELKGSVMANYSNTGFDFSGNDKVLVIFKFDVTASSGSTEITTQIAELDKFHGSDDDHIITDYTDNYEVKLFEENPGQHVTVNGVQAEKGDQIVYTAYLNAGDVLTSINATVSYSSSIIRMSELSISASRGVFMSTDTGCSTNLTTLGTATFSCSDSNGYDFKTSKPFVKLVFNVVASSGDANISIKFDSLKNKSNASVTAKTATEPTIKVLKDEAKNDYFMGDLDGNKTVSVSDTIIIQKAIAEVSTLTDKQTIAADLDFNSRITVADAILIQKYISGACGFDYPPKYA